MKTIERFTELLSYTCVEDWRDRMFQISNELGYERSLLAMLPDRDTPFEAGLAFLHTTYPSGWLDKYDNEKMAHVDPAVSHCVSKSIPLILSPDIFSTHKQKEVYEESCGYGICAGVILPLHGVNGEMGMLCLVSDTRSGRKLECETARNIPELTLFRDFILETSLRFLKPSALAKLPVPLTPRELECLKWIATGKSSWDIGRILNCTEKTVNFHVTNIRQKFGTVTRHQALVKAIGMGIVDPM
ncbi:MAG: LuxR family transcriptional regulator [Gallionellaceae bacterium]|nr:MAG: LuxR family transcriptional regulator [Gallionellaceae bacterium]